MLHWIRKKFSQSVYDEQQNSITLYECCLKGKLEEARQALADPNSQHCDWSTLNCPNLSCLKAAARSNYPELVSLLLSHPRIDVNQRRKGLEVETCHVQILQSAYAAFAWWQCPGIELRYQDSKERFARRQDSSSPRLRAGSWRSLETAPGCPRRGRERQGSVLGPWDFWWTQIELVYTDSNSNHWGTSKSSVLDGCSSRCGPQC